MRLECGIRLLLKVRKPSVQLIAACFVREARPWILAVIARELDVVHGRDHSPDIYKGLARQRAIQPDEPDVRRQVKFDPYEPVLPQIAEIAGVLTVRAEVIGVDRPEQRIVGIRIEPSEEAQKPESLFDVRRRELEMVGRHVAIGAGTAVSVQPAQPSVQERQTAADNRRAGLAPAIGGSLPGSSSGRLILHAACGDIRAGSDDKCGNEGYAAEDQE